MEIQYESSRVVPLQRESLLLLKTSVCDATVAAFLPDSDPGSSTYARSVLKLVGGVVGGVWRGGVELNWSEN